MTSLNLEGLIRTLVHVKQEQVTHEASETAANHRSAGHVSPKNKSKDTRAKGKYGNDVDVSDEERCSVIARDRPFNRADLVYPDLDVRYKICSGNITINDECTR